MGRFENTGELVGSERDIPVDSERDIPVDSEEDIRYAAPVSWHQMGFKGPGLSCRPALGGYGFIDMNNTAGR